MKSFPDVKKHIKLIGIKKGDVVIVFALLFLAIISLFLPWFHKEEGSYVSISINNSLYLTKPLNQDIELEIKDKHGIICNTVSIKDGQVTMIQATCPDHSCMTQHPIKSNNQTIVCLPNKVLVSITDTTREQIDAVSR